MIYDDLIAKLEKYSAMCPDPEEAKTEKAAAEAIRALRFKWTSTEDQLPKPYQGVIVARLYEAGKPLRVEAGMLTTYGWWKVYGTNCKKVSYWMPLPEPPET